MGYNKSTFHLIATVMYLEHTILWGDGGCNVVHTTYYFVRMTYYLLRTYISHKINPSLHVGQRQIMIWAWWWCGIIINTCISCNHINAPLKTNNTANLMKHCYWDRRLLFSWCAAICIHVHEIWFVAFLSITVLLISIFIVIMYICRVIKLY